MAIHVGEVGRKIILAVTDAATGNLASLDTMDEVTYEVEHEVSGKKLTRAAEFTEGTGGTNGEAQFTTKAGEIDQAGRWRFRVKIVDGTDVFYSSTLIQNVEE